MNMYIAKPGQYLWLRSDPEEIFKFQVFVN